MPPATAAPLTAAITGLESCRRDGPMGPRARGSSALKSRSRRPVSPWAARRAPYCRSQPAQKWPWAPWNTATLAVASSSNARKAACRARAVGLSTALRTSGRSRVTIQMSSCFSVVTAVMATTPHAACCNASSSSSCVTSISMRNNAPAIALPRLSSRRLRAPPPCSAPRNTNLSARMLGSGQASTSPGSQGAKWACTRSAVTSRSSRRSRPRSTRTGRSPPSRPCRRCGRGRCAPAVWRSSS